MSAKKANSIVVALIDLDDWGFDEYSLPALVSLANSHHPTCRTFFHTGVMAYFLSSPETKARAEKLITEAKILKNEKGFESLGIGSAEGPLLAEFTWLGKYKPTDLAPIGEAASEATKNARTENCQPARDSEPRSPSNS